MSPIVTIFMQYAGKEAYDNIEAEEKSVSSMVKEFEKRRNLSYNGVKSIEGLELTVLSILFQNFKTLFQKI